MKYIVIYKNQGIIATRVGPFDTLDEATEVAKKVHKSRGVFISEELDSLPDSAAEPLPEYYRWILRQENWLHKSIEKLYVACGKKTPFKSTWAIK